MHPCVEIFWLCYFLYRFVFFACICLSLVSLSLVLAKRLIASLKHYKRILEICLQLILFNLEVRFSVIWGCRKTKDLAVYVKVNWHPLTNVWGQFGPELTSTLFVCLSYGRNRSLDRDLFCGVSSSRLPSAIHILRNSLLLRTMTEVSIPSGQSRMQRDMRIKWALVLG